MMTQHAPTVRVDIFIAGDYDRIVDACQKFCERGLCVSITPTTFAYKFGRETGAQVGLINYPRFPKAARALLGIADELAHYLLDELSQGSCSVVGPERTYWITRREG